MSESQREYSRVFRELMGTAAGITRICLAAFSHAI
jgi:hypothetical protein